MVTKAMLKLVTVCDTPVTVRRDCCVVATDAAKVPVCFR